jgi:hypothetical protein
MVVMDSAWAWFAGTMSCVFHGELGAARRAAERSIAVARERADRFCLVNATGALAFVLASLDAFYESRRLAEQALSVAQASGHRDGLTVAIICMAASFTTDPSRPDFAGARRFIDEHPLDVSDLSASIAGFPPSDRWHGRTRPRPSRFGHCPPRRIRPPRRSCRRDAHLHQAAFALAVTVAERGELILACELVGCADSYLSRFRVANNLQRWLEARLDALLAGLDPVERARATKRGAVLDRRGLMRLLRDAEQLTSQME